MLLVFVGDVHGRFFRVEEWLAALERARGDRVDLVLAVGDVETFTTPDDHRRKATKRTMPAEFADYACGARKMDREFVFVGGNNEAFEDLERHPDGGELAPNVRYLGRAGTGTLHGVHLAWLSGIYAPTRFGRPRVPPTSRETSKQAGYFRQPEVDALRGVAQADVLLLHEWPRGIAGRDSAVARAEARGIRQGFWPQVGNPYGAELIARIHPGWVLCGHLHVPHAATVETRGAGGERWLTRVVCLDQASRPESAMLWMEWEDGAARAVGWGTSATPTWHAGDAWDERQTAARIHREPPGGMKRMSRI
jgi:lariat debranching enzyme